MAIDSSDVTLRTCRSVLLCESKISNGGVSDVSSVVSNTLHYWCVRRKNLAPVFGLVKTGGSVWFGLFRLDPCHLLCEERLDSSWLAPDLCGLKNKELKCT